MRLREEERRAKTKLNVKKMIEIPKHRVCLKIWRLEAEQRARAMQLAVLELDADLDVCPPARPPVPSKQGFVRQRQRRHAPQPGGLYVLRAGAAEDSQQPPTSSLPIAGTTCGHIQDQSYGKHVVVEAGPEGPPRLRRSWTPSDSDTSGGVPSPSASGHVTWEYEDIANAVIASCVEYPQDSLSVIQVDQKTEEEESQRRQMMAVILFRGEDNGEGGGDGRDGRGQGRGDHVDAWFPDRQQGRWAHERDCVASTLNSDWGRSGVDREGGGPDDELAQCVRAREGSAQHTHSYIASEHTDTHCCKEGELAGASDCSDFHTQPVQYLDFYEPGQNLTETLGCEDGLQVFNHQFLLSNSNPVDVMGVDLISKLEQCQISTPEGVEVHKYSDLDSNLKHSNGHDLLFVYQWKLLHAELSSDLLTEAASLVSPDNTDFMTPEDLHCTSHVSPGPDRSYEQSSFFEKSEELTLTHLYWDEHRCAAAVSLSTQQSGLYLIGGSAPHVSLSKFQNEKWKDLGPFVKRCEEASDWQESSDGRTSFSSSLQCKRKSLLLVVHTRLTVELELPSLLPPASCKENQSADRVAACSRFTSSECSSSTQTFQRPKHVPVHPDSQFWFAFYFGSHCYTFTRLCQGYCETSTIYNEALRRSLEPLALTEGTALLQYIDDLMVCSPNREQCEADTVKLLKHLAAEGHKACLSKLQFVQEEVTYLGYIITAEGRTLSSKRVEAIQNCPKPHFIREMRSFLGRCSSCRTFIPNHAVLQAPLNALLQGEGVKSHDKVTWTSEAEEAFEALKLALQTPATLRLPDPSRPFTQVADETDGCMTSVLLQEHQGKMTPIAYFSAKLDPFAAGFPRCLRAAVVAEKAAMASRETVGRSHLTLLAPHDVSMILQEQRRFHIPANFRLRYKTDFADMPSVTVKRCTALNPATLLPSPGNVEEHNCTDVLQHVFPPRPNLKKTPLTNADLVLFIDGSASRDPLTGQNNVGFAVVSTQKPLAWASLPSDCSAPAAALIALTEACKLAEGKNVTIYTGSRYAFGVVHDFDALWENRKFLKWDFEPFFHHDKVADLLDAILLPKSVAVCLFQAHTNDSKCIPAGNERARAAAADAAREPPPEAPAARFSSGPASLTALQSFATDKERKLWRSCGAHEDGGVWRGPDDKPCLPKHFFPHFAKLTHGPDHQTIEAMLDRLAQDWFPKGDRETRALKTKLEKYCKGTGLLWPEALPFVLMHPSQQVQAAFPPASQLLHDIQPGHWILVNEAQGEGWEQGRRVGPYQVLLTTHTAVKHPGPPLAPRSSSSTQVLLSPRAVKLNVREQFCSNCQPGLSEGKETIMLEDHLEKLLSPADRVHGFSIARVYKKKGFPPSRTPRAGHDITSGAISDNQRQLCNLRCAKWRDTMRRRRRQGTPGASLCLPVSPCVFQRLSLQMEHAQRAGGSDRQLSQRTPSAPDFSPTGTAAPPPHIPLLPPAHSFPRAEEEPMQIGRSRLSPQEWEQRLRDQLCLYCGKRGHFIKACPVRPKGSCSPVGGVLVSRAVIPQPTEQHNRLFPATLSWDKESIPVSVLIDSGADESLMDFSLARQAGVPLVPLDRSLSPHAIDGRSLGRPWLERHDPHISWASGQILGWSVACHANCLHSAPSPSSNPRPALTPPARVLEWGHSSCFACHPGVRQTAEFVQRRFWWPNLQEDVRKFVGACTVCARKAILRATEQSRRSANRRRRRAPAYWPGQKVWLLARDLPLQTSQTSSRKLNPRYIGPYTICSIINPSTVRLDLPAALKVHPVFHVSLIKPFSTSPLSPPAPTPPSPQVLSDGEPV
ncbi:Retrovirus-related Pol polyprotein from transposon opus [Takifugu flavidus]|uniref:ribonuclease H n=1 Tax=Takifugu flavidus TaxID=433684 RepID=A0A5C6MKD5_9TELE|nr:Retrovirus-related Pol polyprotein from transposon opus [Takifugu flavidus]